NSSYPRKGWAQVFQQFFDETEVEILNRARSGRSSKTFYHEPGAWPRVKADLRQGDFLFIQFGHNDGKLDPAIGTAPFGSFQDYISRYILEARSRAAVPVLLTPIHRNRWEDDSLRIRDTHFDYPVAMRQLADSLDVPLIDLTALSDSLYEAFGMAYTTDHIFLNLPEHVYPNFPDGMLDDTHLQETGAYEIANLAAAAISRSRENELAYLKDNQLPMVRLRLMTEPFSHGYIKGPRYFPENIPKTLKAFAAPGFEFRHWMKEQKITSGWPQQTFSLSAGDTSKIVAQFGLFSGPDFENKAPKVGISKEGQMIEVRSDSPLVMFRFFDAGGRNLFSWNVKGNCNLSINQTGLEPGIYVLYLQWKGSQNCYKLLVRE
ncbi:MAG: rhamnogalacturonan acetylesterase, partial [Bacteroidia bacterium]